MKYAIDDNCSICWCFVHFVMVNGIRKYIQQIMDWMII